MHFLTFVDPHMPIVGSIRYKPVPTMRTLIRRLLGVNSTMPQQVRTGGERFLAELANPTKILGVLVDNVSFQVPLGLKYRSTGIANQRATSVLP